MAKMHRELTRHYILKCSGRAPQSSTGVAMPQGTSTSSFTDAAQGHNSSVHRARGTEFYLSEYGVKMSQASAMPHVMQQGIFPGTYTFEHCDGGTDGQGHWAGSPALGC